jgi:hypothetical protein
MDAGRLADMLAGIKLAAASGDHDNAACRDPAGRPDCAGMLAVYRVPSLRFVARKWRARPTSNPTNSSATRRP